jgi:hypothetical protein
MSANYESNAHLEWLGYLQPVGLVVSPPALAAAGAYPNKNIISDHARFLECVEQITLEGESEPRAAVRQFARFATHVFGWEPADLIGTSEGGPLPDTLEVTLTEYNETLRPTYAVRELSNAAGADAKWLLLVEKVKAGVSLDDAAETDDHRWQASPQARFERLLRGTHVPIGLLSNGISLRLVYAPHGETSGHLTFPVKAMTEVAGRPIFAALHMLLSAERLFTLSDKQRLPAILAESRKYQNLVSTKLAGQVLGLFERLREDAGRHTDTMDHRFGAWAQLLTLFRLTSRPSPTAHRPRSIWRNFSPQSPPIGPSGSRSTPTRRLRGRPPRL